MTKARRKKAQGSAVDAADTIGGTSQEAQSGTRRGRSGRWKALGLVAGLVAAGMALLARRRGDASCCGTKACCSATSDKDGLPLDEIEAPETEDVDGENGED